MHRIMAKILIVVLFAMGAAALLAAAAGDRSAAADQAAQFAPEGMVYVPSGEYERLYRDEGGSGVERVAAFHLDRYPVTNSRYRAFLEARPEWRRSRISPLFADEGYLSHWNGDLDFGPDSLANRPVVNVSWFAAQAYAEWAGRRLPTTSEWERAAALPVATAEEAYRQRLLAWYGRPVSGALPPVDSMECNEAGACGLHGLVWEWVDDFNANLVTGESRNNSELDIKQFCGTSAVNARDFSDYTAFLRFGFRSGLEARYTVRSLGFRTASGPFGIDV